MALPAENDNVLPFSEKPHITLVMVTPEMASRWLEKNLINRTIRRGRVNQYANDMTHGNWKLTGEPVKFSITGRLQDGQHRLLAVVESGVTVPMFIARGLPDDVQAYMDSGSARTAGDNLSMQGVYHANLLAAAARVGVIVDRGVLYRDRKSWMISKADIYQWINAHPAIQRSAAFIANGHPRSVKVPASTKTYAHFRFAQVDEAWADRFFVDLGSMNFADATPLRALSSRLYQLGVNRTKAELPDMLSMLFRAWNAYRDHRDLTSIPLISKNIKRELPDLI